MVRLKSEVKIQLEYVCRESGGPLEDVVLRGGPEVRFHCIFFIFAVGVFTSEILPNIKYCSICEC